MEAVGRYLFCVSGASLIGAIILATAKGTAHHAVMKMICGIFLLLCVIHPITDVSITGINAFALPFRESAEDAALTGEEYAWEQLCAIIKQETEAYILDKATQLDADIQVDVTLSQDALPQPVSVVIRGSVAPYSKQKLRQIIAQELNIAKENQVWTG